MGLREELKQDTRRIMQPLTKQLPANTQNKVTEAKKAKKLNEAKLHVEGALDGTTIKTAVEIKREKKEKSTHIDAYPHLQDISKLPPDEAREIRSRGGKAAGAAKREKASLKKCMQTLLDMPVQDKKTMKMLSDMGFDARQLTYRVLISIGILRSAAMGNVSALHEIRDLIGEIDKVNTDDLDLNITINRAKKHDEAEEV